MIIHYLKIAWRNLLKYKTQSVISILGLAIGFTAFSFTMSWIRYEMGYDSHNPNADRIYKVFEVNDRVERGVQFNVPPPLKMYLEEMPEVEAVTAIETDRRDFGNIRNGHIIQADTSFFKVFYPDIYIDYPEIMPEGQDLTVISGKSARLLGLNSADIGRPLSQNGSPLIGIVSGLPEKQTNVPFDVLSLRPLDLDPNCPWCIRSKKIYVRIRENVNVESLSAKIDSMYIEGSHQGVMSYILVPLQKVHYTYPEDEARIKFNHLWIFASVSVLVILCAFFNYLMLFVNKIKLRSRELALRKVNGASNKKLAILLLVEIGLILFSSLFTGAVLTELLYPFFVKFSEIEASKQFLLGEMILYGIAILVFSLLSALVPIFFFMKKNVVEIIQPEVTLWGGIKNSFTKVSLFIQLLVGTLLIFCTFIFLYQYNNLNSTDIGFDRFHRNTFSCNTYLTKNEILKIAGVEKVIFFYGQFLPRSARMFSSYKTEAGEVIESESIEIHEPEFIDFFDMKILEGRNFHDGEIKACLINEAAKRKYGFTDPIGKVVENRMVIGVVADMYIDAPSLPVLPIVYYLRENMETDMARLNPETGEYESLRGAVFSSSVGSGSLGFRVFAYMYLPGHRESTEQAIKKLVTDNGGKEFYLTFTNIEEVYAGYTQSERYLLILLTMMTGIAILIALFGIYSMITLSCSQRRKEIAIRKVNGAKGKEIFGLFFREYFMVTLLSCIVAFPIGVYIMQRWLEQYTRRVSMEWWIFAGIFLLVAVIVFGSIFFRVNTASKENPAEVMKAD